jgi:hypothetical protein
MVRNDATLPRMRRRTFFTLSAAAGTLLVVAGGTLVRWRPALQDGRLTEAGRSIFAALAPAILGALWPAGANEQGPALEAFLGRLDTTLAGLPPPLRADVDDMLSLLDTTVGRIVLAGLREPWADASLAEVVAALQGLRISSWPLRQQIFHALRDLTNAAYFASPATWAAIGYPGPRPL